MITANEAKKDTKQAQEILWLEEMKREIERKTRLDDFIQKTIDYCDNELSITIHENAIKGKNGLTLYWGLDTYNEFKQAYCNLNEKKEYYANGDSSFSRYGAPIYLPAMIDYLKENGYEVYTHDWNYKEYGLGVQSGIRIEISWNP